MRDLEEYCVVIRSYKVRQRHIIQTEPVRKNKVQGVTFIMAWLLNMLGQIKGVCKSDKIRVKRGGKWTADMLKCPKPRTLSYCAIMRDKRSENYCKKTAVDLGGL